MTATQTKRTLRDVAEESESPWFRNRLARMLERCELLPEMPLDDAPSGVLSVERGIGTGEWDSRRYYVGVVGGDVDCDAHVVGEVASEVPHSSESIKGSALMHRIEKSIVSGPGTGSDDWLGRFVSDGRVLSVPESADGLSESVDRLLCEVVGPTHLYMTRRQWLCVCSEDRLGDRVATPHAWRGIPVIFTDPLGHNCPPSTGIHGRIYALNLSGDESSVRLIQMQDIEGTYLGRLDNPPNRVRTRWEWNVGLAVPDPRGVAALDGIGDAIKAIWPDMEDN